MIRTKDIIEDSEKVAKSVDKKVRYARKRDRIRDNGGIGKVVDTS